MPVVFHTATTVNGFLADENDSLDWLFAVAGEHPDAGSFYASVTVLVVGSTTYEWVLNNEALIEHPEKWQTFFGQRPMFVFTTRSLPVPQGADVRFVRGEVADHLAAIRAVAGEGTIWVQGGGDLAGQFFDADALDEIVLSIAPAFLRAGRPLFPRDVFADRLNLISADRVGQFVQVRYQVNEPTRTGA